MMAFIIVFTIFCEQTLAAGRRWTNYHNPLMQPFLDKVVSELMILGSTAFAILIVNESTENGLSDGSVLPSSYYHTLHWIDTVIFVFAILYVAIATYTLFLLCENLTAWLASRDAQAVHRMFEKGTNESKLKNTNHKHHGIRRLGAVKQLQYSLIKKHFKKVFFNDSDIDIDFVFYIEVTLIYAITACFTIGVFEWFVLFLACLAVIKGVFILESYKVFGLCCVLLLAIAVAVGFSLPSCFYEILRHSFDIKNPHDLKQLEVAIDTSMSRAHEEHDEEKRRRKERRRKAGCCGGLCKPHIPELLDYWNDTQHFLTEHHVDPHQLAQSVSRRIVSVRPSDRKVNNTQTCAVVCALVARVVCVCARKRRKAQARAKRTHLHQKLAF